MVRKQAGVLGVLLLVLSGLQGLGAVGSGGTVDLEVGVFVFEQGESVAVEVRRDGDCTCLCDPITVGGLSVLDGAGVKVFSLPCDPPASIDSWIGRWSLIDDEGKEIPAGIYRLAVTTSAGEFRAVVEVVPPGEKAAAGHGLARASACGLSLSVYRVLDEARAGTKVVLDVREGLLIALRGNPTTGYEWEIEDEPGAVLERIEGASYLPDPALAGLVGSGGTFYFRYRATTVGEGTLLFAYRRPWVAGPPDRTVSFSIVVR